MLEYEKYLEIRSEQILRLINNIQNVNIDITDNKTIRSIMFSLRVFRKRTEIDYKDDYGIGTPLSDTLENLKKLQ